jgi:hypothetical protein
MKNPWLKENPVMSMFLSAATAWIGVIHGQATKAAKRNLAAVSKPTP